jgi:flagellar basal body-associated protein FliL
MPKIDSKSFKFVKLMFLILCVVIVMTVITVGLVILGSQKSKQSTPKERGSDNILSFIKNFYFVFKLNTK